MTAVLVNGTRREVPAPATVAALVAELAENPEGRGIAVVVDGEVVPRGRWGDTALRPEASVEVLTAVGGG